MQIYKIMSVEDADAFRMKGEFRGAEIDVADGYIHFSTAGQVASTLAKHFAGRTDLVLVTVGEAQLAGPLRWEPARGGALFPHLYAALPWSAVMSVEPLPIGQGGVHQLPGTVSSTVSGTVV